MTPSLIPNVVALDFKKLMMACECMTRRKLLTDVWAKLSFERITAVVTHWDGNDYRNLEGVVHSAPSIDCEQCRNTGFRLSEEGKQLVEWLERYATDFIDEVVARRKKEEVDHEE